MFKELKELKKKKEEKMTHSCRYYQKKFIVYSNLGSIFYRSFVSHK